jgi:hypothetical protein
LASWAPPLPQIGNLITASPIDDRDLHVTPDRPPEDQALLMHSEIDLLRLGGVEGDRQVITRRDEPLSALRLENVRRS